MIKKHLKLLIGDDAPSQVVSTSKSPFILFPLPSPTMVDVFSVLGSLGRRIRDLLYLRACCKDICVL